MFSYPSSSSISPRRSVPASKNQHSQIKHPIASHPTSPQKKKRERLTIRPHTNNTHKRRLSSSSHLAKRSLVQPDFFTLLSSSFFVLKTYSSSNLIPNIFHRPLQIRTIPPPVLLAHRLPQIQDKHRSFFACHDCVVSLRHVTSRRVTRNAWTTAKSRKITTTTTTAKIDGEEW